VPPGHFLPRSRKLLTFDPGLLRTNQQLSDFQETNVVVFVIDACVYWAEKERASP
jgi:hypothetical protein